VEEEKMVGHYHQKYPAEKKDDGGWPVGGLEVEGYPHHFQTVTDHLVTA